MVAAEPLYRAEGIDKYYGGAVALKGVDFELRAGEVHALVGANGAGKSTLMKILAGTAKPTRGTVSLDDERVTFSSAGEAERAGVAMVSQELSVYPTIDVLHNLFIPREPTRGGLISRQRMRADASEVLERVGLTIPLEREAAELRLAEQQLLEIARALLRRPRVLILDEPTSALNVVETQRLLDVVRQLRSGGVTVIYVSHFLEDVMVVADVITVLRDGEVVAARVPVADTDIERMVGEMLGETALTELAAPPAKRSAQQTERDGAAVRLEGVSVQRRLSNVSLSARPGEIVGLAGLDGSGPGAVFELLFGRVRSDSGTVVMQDGGSSPSSPMAAVRRGVAFVPADRRRLGLMTGKSIWENVGLARLTQAGRGPRLMRPHELRQRALARGAQVGLQMTSTEMLVDELSGGNQQKVVFAKWLEADPSVLLLDDPTRGVDVGARADMHEIVRTAANAGRITLFYSSDVAEYVMLCDRVIVFHRGRAVDELTGDAIQHNTLLTLINGGRLTPPADDHGPASDSTDRLKIPGSSIDS
jgi:ABC-type sugar transport system ATPase subunit